ncbi:MAG: YceD family protein [Chlorobium sp.]
MHKEKLLIEIRTSTLTEGINKLDFTCQARDFEGRRLAEAGFTGEITVTVIAKKSDDEIMVTINTSAVADAACDRCLAPIAKVLTGSLDLFYTFGTSFDREEDGNDEYRLIDKSTEYIDLAEDVCDTLILSVPMKITCTNNPDCRLFSSHELSGSREENKEPQAGQQTSWQESLEKLKEKYR